MTRLEEENRIGKGGTLVGQLSRLDLIVLDELDCQPFARSGGPLLFHLSSKLYGRTSVILTTNLAFGEWPARDRARHRRSWRCCSASRKPTIAPRRSKMRIMSAATLSEALIVADRRGVGAEMAELVEGLGIEIAPVTPAAARRVASAYALWGKGIHPASLNFGDCFAYEAAKENGCPLLFVGDVFAWTDIAAAL